MWNFVGIGPRRTQSVAGGLMATAPFHWSGDVEDQHHHETLGLVRVTLGLEHVIARLTGT